MVGRLPGPEVGRWRNQGWLAGWLAIKQHGPDEEFAAGDEQVSRLVQIQSDRAPARARCASFTAAKEMPQIRRGGGAKYLQVAIFV